MALSCYSGNFSSCSLGSSLRYPRPFCVSSYPSNLVHSTDLCSPSTCPLGSSLYRGCQETCYKPSSCQTSCVGSNPHQTSCSRPRTSILCRPCLTTYTGCLGYGSRSVNSLGCASRCFRPLGYGVWDFPSLGYRSGFCRQSSCFRPIFGSSFY